MNSFLACKSSILLIGVHIVGCRFLSDFNPLVLFLCIHPLFTIWAKVGTTEKQLLLMETLLPPKYSTANIL